MARWYEYSGIDCDGPGCNYCFEVSVTADDEEMEKLFLIFCCEKCMINYYKKIKEH